MATLVMSAAGSVGGLHHYLTQGPNAAEAVGKDGVHERVLIASTVGNCSVETYPDDVAATEDRMGKHPVVSAFHLVISQSNAEIDPNDPVEILRQHEMMRKLVERGFPGHQALVVSQADNGKAVQYPGEAFPRFQVTAHTHGMVANVAEARGVVEAPGYREGGGLSETLETRTYEAGRCADFWMTNIERLRWHFDEVVREVCGYDNGKYMLEVRKTVNAARYEALGLELPADKAAREAVLSAPLKDRIVPADHEQRNRVLGRDGAGRPQLAGLSDRDALKVTLREASALSTSWDEYVERLGSKGVVVQTSGKGGMGVSYEWTGAVSQEPVRARARGRDGLGPMFTRAEVTKQCEANLAKQKAGVTLSAPKEVEVLSALVPPEKMPKPVYVNTVPPPPPGIPPHPPGGGSGSELVEPEAAAIRRMEKAGSYEDLASARLQAALLDELALDREALLAVGEFHELRLEGGAGQPLVVALADHDFAVEASALNPNYTADGIDNLLADLNGRERDERRTDASGEARDDDRAVAGGGTGTGGTRYSDRIDRELAAAEAAAARDQSAAERLGRALERREQAAGEPAVRTGEHAGAGAADVASQRQPEQGSGRDGRDAGAASRAGSDEQRRESGNSAQRVDESGRGADRAVERDQRAAVEPGRAAAGDQPEGRSDARESERSAQVAAGKSDTPRRDKLRRDLNGGNKPSRGNSRDREIGD